MTITKEDLFGQLDFTKIADNIDFKEDSVREVIILPILKALGYNNDTIIRSKSLQHPFLKIGSKKRPITLVPDYALKVESNFAWVLDAKAPNQKIINDDNVEQVYSYATHPEIRSNYFALCNGLEFSIYRTVDTDKPILFFNVDEIEQNWNDLKMFLSPDSFHIGKNFTYDTTTATAKPKGAFDYNNRPLLEEIISRKQAAKRHFGIHGYFTRQSWNIVAEYIKNYSKPGDVVLDPFGGTGITVIEALMNDRKAINIDLNPLAVFIVKSLIAPVNQKEFIEEFNNLKIVYQKKIPKTEEEIALALKKYPYPKEIKVAKIVQQKRDGNVAEYVSDLFTDKQLAQLACLKHFILKIKDAHIRNSLLLAFSSTLTKINRTYHNSGSRDENSGNTSAFQYYKYRYAEQEFELDVWNTFQKKFSSVLNAKKEIESKINNRTIENAQIVKDTATNLKWIQNESIDYIYTDPPYGNKIFYLDLSIMWNAWLDLDVSEEDYNQEAIEGGEHKKSKNDYNTMIAESIKEMYRVLKFDRWLSFVFAHKDPEFWHLIIETAESCGFEYAGAVPQKNGQTSYHKRKLPFSTLSGQLIINFKKVRNPKTIMKAHLGIDIAEIVIQTIEGIIAKNHGATLEQINDELIIKGLELGFLDLLKKEYTDLTPILMDNFDYDETTEIFSIKKDTKFKTHIDVRLRILYYLTSYLRRKEREGKPTTFDEIVLNILPLLKNGITPEHQTILNVLEDIGERVEKDNWRLKKEGQGTLFD